MKLFKEMYSYEMPALFRLLGVTRICENSIEFKWGYISFGHGPELQIDHTYEEGVPRICFCLIWMAFHVELPFIKQRYEDVNNSPRYGFIYHDKIAWWNWGLKNYTFHMPWDWDIYRSVVRGKNGEWIDYKFESEDIHKEVHPYKYTLRDGEIQERAAIIHEEYREWRWRWFKLLPYPKIARRTISVEFDGEVGEKTGSWKGGCTGCGYDLKAGESMLSCLRRMEAERKF